MNRQAQIYYAVKFYPHLVLRFGVACIQESLKAHGIPFEVFSL